MSLSENGNTDFSSDTSTPAWLDASGFSAGFISPYYDSDWYTTYLVAGVQYRIDMHVNNTDAYLVLRNAQGSVVTYRDVNGPGGTETITFTPATSGQYYIDAQSYRPSFYNTGVYVLELTSNAADDWVAQPETTSTLTIGNSVVGQIEIAADADWHRVQLTAGQCYIFHLTGTRSDGFLQIFDSDGLEVGVADQQSLSFSPSVNGTYYIGVAGNGLTDTGSYRLHAALLPQISIQNQELIEGDSGTSWMTFAISLSAPAAVNVTVDFDTRDSTALAGFDYSSVNRSVTIAAGTTSVLVSVPILGNAWHQPNRVFEVVLSNPQNATIRDDSASGIVVDDDAPSDLNFPTDSGMPFQWYLYNIRADLAWAQATGKGIKVGVFDQGVDAVHQDLRNNTNLALGFDASTQGPGGVPKLSSDNHGTLVAGVIGAARDGQGIVGVAYDATIVPIYSSLRSDTMATDAARGFFYAKNLDVLNNSWGFGNKLQEGTNWAFFDDAKNPAFAPAFAALRDLTASGRQGLGTVVVQAAGNGYDFGDDTNLHNFQNSRYIITVGATDAWGQASGFSTRGASILVSAPGGNGNESWGSILTTDRVGTPGENGGNYAFIDGTSFSAPIVSGIVAMMLEVNPHLGYRDVQQILAYTARQTAIGVGDWEVNGATNWNGGGMHYNSLEHAAGFGQVDALAAVRLAAGWVGPSLTVANTVELSRSKTVNTVIPDNSDNGVFSSIQVTEVMDVERVDVSVNIRHTFIGDLSILLVSPSGTTSFLLWRPAQGALSAYGSSQDNISFTFNTVLNWGESSRGIWGISVYDNATGDTGAFVDWTLTLVGKPDSVDDVYVYTNEYENLASGESARSILRDTNGGFDTINAAALGLDCRIDLTGQTTSILNGKSLTIADGTYIERAISGDGHDTLIASNRDTELRGMGGNDSLHGGTGNDIIHGCAGNDAVDGGTGFDAAHFSGAASSYRITESTGRVSVSDQRGLDGADSLSGIEKLVFSDMSMNLTASVIADTIQGASVDRIAELYVAFFNRTPDGDGMAYWMTQFKSGQGIEQIADAFYNAGIHFSSLTGFSSGMSNEAFVNVVYRNVLGRADGADAEGLAYWSSALTSGAASRGSLVSSILDSAHTFKGNATWGWVADLLDNKISVAKQVAIDWGVTYNTSEDSISKGMAIAAAITSSNTSAAIDLVGVSPDFMALG